MNLHRSQSGSVLIGVLWCVVLLAVVVIGILHTSRLDLTAGKFHTDRIQAHYLALAGVEKAKALLFQDSSERSRSGVHHGPGLYNAPEVFRNVSLGRGRFHVLRSGSPEEGGRLVFGVSDEESRLNLNVAGVNQLTNLIGLTADIAAAIVDWRDGDNAASPGGAEEDYYASLRPPYLPRNAAFPTVRELLMVRGITQELLGDTSPPSPADPGSVDEGEADAMVNPGWSSLLTAHSGVEDVDASGSTRVNLQTADVTALTGIRGITQPVAQAIIAHRNRQRFESLADLLEVRAGGQTTPGNQNPNNPPTGPTLINEQLLKEIADHLTIEERPTIEGAINVNTAGVEVLMCLPGVARPLAQAIVAQRQSNGAFPNVAALLEVPGMTRDLFKQLAPLISVRSETFRILSEGQVGSRGTRQRIEVVVHIGRNTVSTLAYREDDL
ncbi:MAG: general secretion pathway protein GspK [Verrucomicrobiae bacterium]|nr:general secretion pathway protein GspK [Verrucomicrobiae bacterium]